MNSDTYSLFKFKECFSRRQKENPSYSLRAFARDLEISPSSLSKILMGKRSIPKKRAKDFVKKLKLSPREEALFLGSISIKVSDQNGVDLSEKQFLLDESYYKIISEWEHFAVLELFNIEEMVLTVEGISEKLGINKLRTKVVLENLSQSNLIAFESGRYVRTHTDVKTTDGVISRALVASHLEGLDMGKKKLQEVDLDLRDFSSLTLAVDLGKMNEAKILIKEFRNKMKDLFADGNKEEVYQVAVQIFPLSNIKQIRRLS